MTHRFVALPVGQGDAFFLQRGDFTVLVDGGRSKKTLPRLFSQHVKRDQIDALICTHNDADHANGVLGFLKSSLQCKEAWLPALWTNRLADILDRPEEFVKELSGEIADHLPRESDLDVEPPLTLEAIGKLISKEMDADPQNRRDPDGHDGPGPTELSYALGLEEDTDIDVRSVPWSPEFYFHPEPSRRLRLFLEALGAAKNIRKIVKACCHRGVPIRWFEYNRNSAGGGRKGLLKPLNANEVSMSSVPRLSALKILALTTANRESLTFCSPQSDDFPGVIFAADSDLRFPQRIPWQPEMIVTAPHHGSNDNKAAYARPKRDNFSSSDLIWVRSDGNFKKRPCPDYLSLRWRYCTICRGVNPPKPKQCLEFTANGGKWIPVPEVRSCECKKI